MQGNFVQILLLGVGNSSMIPLFFKFSTTMKHTCLKHLNTLFKKLQQQLDFLSRNPCKLDYKL